MGVLFLLFLIDSIVDTFWSGNVLDAKGEAVSCRCGHRDDT